MASIDRTAYPRFKRVVWSSELAESFTPEAGEIEWARGKTTTDQHFLALAVRLKCYQRLGYFPKLDEVPEVVVGHVRGKLGLPEGTAAEVDADRTAKRHRQFIRERLRVRPFGSGGDQLPERPWVFRRRQEQISASVVASH